MKRVLHIAILTALALAVCGGQSGPDGEKETVPAVIKLYPEGAAESSGLTGPEQDNGRVITNVTDPELHLYLPPGKKDTQAVLVCPGGGYRGLSWRIEGVKTAEWLNARGIAAAVLKYRMPNGNSAIPLKDARAAMEILRSRAEEWGIDGSNTGVMGFSAGGHLAASLATMFASETERPDFAVLVYPVVTMGELTNLITRRQLLGEEAPLELKDEYSAEMRVGASTPPVFIAFSDDDKTVDPRNGTILYDSLKANGVPAELHIYPAGGHAWGFDDARTAFTRRGEFYAALERWLAER